MYTKHNPFDSQMVSQGWTAFLPDRLVAGLFPGGVTDFSLAMSVCSHLIGHETGTQHRELSGANEDCSTVRFQ